MGNRGLFALLMFVMLPSLGMAQSRKAKIEWVPLGTATAYDIEISKSKDMIPSLAARRTDRSFIEIALDPGVYFYRVRYRESDGSLAPWSDVQKFTVEERPPVIVSPSDMEVFRESIPIDGILLEWRSEAELREFEIEIKSRDGTVLDRTVSMNRMFWHPKESGVYQWRVRLKHKKYNKWSRSKKFKVLSSALNARPKRTVETARNYDPVKKTPIGWRFFTSAQLAQALAFFGVNETSVPVNSSESAGVGAASIELGLAARKKRPGAWSFGSVLGLDVFRQSINNEDFFAPRGYVRLFASRNQFKWALAPFVQYSLRKSFLFYSSSSITPNTFNTGITRAGVGFGTTYQYRFGMGRKNILKFLGMLRYDFGGRLSNHDSVAADVTDTLGYEFSTQYSRRLNRTMSLDFRVRVLGESYKWDLPFSGEQSFEQNLLLFGAGVSFEF